MRKRQTDRQTDRENVRRLGQGKGGDRAGEENSTRVGVIGLQTEPS